MKNNYFVIFCCCIGLACGGCTLPGSSTLPAKAVRYKNDSQNLYSINDEFQAVQFIVHSEFYRDYIEHPFFLYITKKESQSWLKAFFRYDGSDWIFFEQAILINEQGERMAWEFKSYDKETDVHSGGSVTEKIDVPVGDAEMVKLKHLLGGTNIQIRLAGKNAKEYKLSKEVIAALNEVIAEYQVLQKQQ